MKRTMICSLLEHKGTDRVRQANCAKGEFKSRCVFTDKGRRMKNTSLIKTRTQRGGDKRTHTQAGANDQTQVEHMKTVSKQGNKEQDVD